MMSNEVKLYRSGTLVSSAQVMTGETLQYGGNDSMIVSSGGTANSTAVDYGGSMSVSSGGVANSTEVEGGSMSVSSGGVANSTTVNDWGRLYVSSGGTANSTTVNDGTLYVSNGGVANSTTVNSGGDLYVSSGGVANSTTVNSRGYLYVSSGGVANNTTVNSRGYLYVSSGGTANSTAVDYGGSMSVSSGGVATVVFNPWQGTILSESGAQVTYLDRDANVYYQNQDLETKKGNAVSNVTLAAHQSAIIYSGGTVTQFAIENGGTLELHSGGVLNGFTAQEDLTLKDATVLSCVHVSGKAQLTPGIDVSEVTVLSGGRMSVGEFALGSDVSVSSGGNVFVLGGGTVENITVSSQGGVYVMGGGEVKGEIEIAEGGGLYLYGGSIVDGEIHVQGTLYVDETMVSGGHITIDLNDASSAARIQNLDYLSGTDTFTVETADAGPGTYTLASGGTDYDGTVSVSDHGSQLCTLSAGESQTVDDRNYTLTKNDDTLSLVVRSVVVKATRGDFGETIGISDILFQRIQEDPTNPLGAWMDASPYNWVGDLGPAPVSDWTVYGAYDFTGDGVCDIMFRSTNEATAYAVGYYDMGHGREFKTMGWGVTEEWELADVGDFNGNGVSDILWKNTQNGYLGLWMDGTDQWIDIPYSGLTAGQTVVGTGDANGDGNDDIIINFNGTLGSWDISAIIDGSGTAPVRTDFAGGIGSDWDTVGCADFDGNGIADVVLWNDNGYVGTYMNCNGGDFRCIYASASKDEWGIPGFGDYDGDGSEDVLVRNLETGALGYWDGNDNFSWHAIGYGVDSTWAVIA